MQNSLRGHLRRRCAYGLLPLVALVLAAGCGDGQETARFRDNSGCRTSTRVAAFAKEIDSARPLALRMKRGFGAPGLAIAVAVDGQVVWSEVCGYADLSRRTPVTAATRFRIGSVSKTLTAAAAARLAQDKRLDLDAPIQRYVASFPAKSHPVTARELLAHVAGIRHYQGSEALSGVHYASVTDALRVFAGDPLLFEPGTQYSYSSYGFNLVGAAIEAIAGEDFGEAVRRLVLAPLDLQHTAIDDGRQHQSWAAPYEVTEARKAIPAPSVDLSNRLPSGGFRSTAEDLARFGSRLGDRTFLRSRRKTPSSPAAPRRWQRHELRARLRGGGGAVRPRRRPHRQCRRGHGLPARATSGRCRNCDGHERRLRNRPNGPRPQCCAGSAGALRSLRHARAEATLSRVAPGIPRSVVDLVRGRAQRPCRAGCPCPWATRRRRSCSGKGRLP